MKKEEHERRMNLAREEAARVWCQPETEKIAMDDVLAEEFAKVLVKHMYAPKLGCATTRQILEELKTRIEVDGKLDYKTIDQH